MLKFIKNFIRKRQERRLRKSLLFLLIQRGEEEYNKTSINRLVTFILDGFVE